MAPLRNRERLSESGDFVAGRSEALPSLKLGTNARARPLARMLMFAPLDMHGEERADLHRAARLSILRDRVVRRMDHVEVSADKVERALAAFAEATHQTAAGERAATTSAVSFFHLEENQTLGM
ncbi:hypothetical protein [Mesorhizobium sp.]|uniref:hypothetical protein n=1 Tax=Mesorhizobium sp. TaxID=1871066 RepID=UPI0025EB2735|nr:hypothetical protein [Mesorhizobium sp.]